MISVNAGSSQIFTPTDTGSSFVVSANGGAVGYVSGTVNGVAITGVKIDQLPLNRSFGPMIAGDSITVSVQTGSVSVFKQSSSGDIDQSPVGPYTDLATLNATYPPASNAGKTAIVGKERWACDGKTWSRAGTSGPFRNFTNSLKKLGATAYDLTTHATVGVTALTRSLTGDYPRFSTATIKCDCTASFSQIRFQSINALADPDDLLLTLDIYLPFHPDEFGQTRYPVLTNPSISIRVCNPTVGTGSDSWTWSFDATYLRKGWNTLKMWAGDTIGTVGSGTLAVGMARTVAGAGASFALAIQYLEISFSNMNGKTVYVDQLRRGAKAKTKLVMGFDASGSAYNDTTFTDKVAPLFAQYGTTGYTTLTNIYEMIYSGGSSWMRQIDLYERFGWDVINHTWSHGGTTVGRNQIVTASRATNVVTVVCSAAHGIPIGTVLWGTIRGSQDAAANGVFKMTVTTANNLTYASTGTDGALAGTIYWCTYLSEVFDGSDTSLQPLLNHEIGDVSRTMRSVGFQRSAHIGAYPNNMCPELSMLKIAAADAGVKLFRAYRSGMAMQNEFGLDNPLHIGSIEMGSGAAGTTTTYVKDKLAGAIGRGDHMWTYGHYVLDETTLGVSVDLEYPPSLGGNPAPPAAGISGTGGWWYLGQIKRFLSESVGPAIAAGNLELMTPSQFSDFVGLGVGAQ